MSQSEALRLSNEGGVDYVLEGVSCWIETGNVLLYLRKDEGGLIIEAFDNQNELLGETIGELHLKGGGQA